MTTIQKLWLIIGCLWVATECGILILGRRQKATIQHVEKSSEFLLWWVISLSVLMALVFKELHAWPIPLSSFTSQLLALSLFLSGFCIRMFAVISLGKFFSTRVCIHKTHRLITTGLYRYIRHPSYSGLLICFFAAGIAMGDFLSLSVLLIPLVIALVNRINVEEKFLQQFFGYDYQQYCLQTKKIIPKIY